MQEPAMFRYFKSVRTIHWYASTFFLNFFSRLNSSRKHTANYLGRKTSLKIRQITQGKDGHGLKLIKVGQHFSISTGMLQAAKKKIKLK